LSGSAGEVFNHVLRENNQVVISFVAAVLSLSDASRDEPDMHEAQVVQAIRSYFLVT
jgi:hypothetical protein